MKVLVFGASGLLGRAVVDEWGSDEAIPATSKDADIRDASQVRRLVSQSRPDWTILAAGYTDVDGCERNPTLAHEVNCRGAENAAGAAREFGSRMMLLSSDYVFDGAKSEPYEVGDPVRPLGRYGRSKAAAEAAVRDILPDCCIVRTSWLFGAPGRCFPNTILELAAERKKLAVVSDQRGSPTFNRDLARAIVRLVQAGAKGMIHAANGGDCSWFEFAQEIVRSAGLTDIEVLPISTREANRPAPRPPYSVLSCTSLAGCGIRMRPWQEALQAYLHERFDLQGVSRRDPRNRIQASSNWNQT